MTLRTRSSHCLDNLSENILPNPNPGGNAVRVRNAGERDRSSDIRRQSSACKSHLSGFVAKLFHLLVCVFLLVTYNNTCKITDVVMLSQIRRISNTKDPHPFPPLKHYSVLWNTACEKQVSGQTNVHKLINHIYTHTHVCTLRHTNLCSFEAVSFHVRMAGLICGESDPCWG